MNFPHSIARAREGKESPCYRRLSGTTTRARACFLLFRLNSGAESRDDSVGSAFREVNNSCL